MARTLWGEDAYGWRSYDTPRGGARAVRYGGRACGRGALGPRSRPTRCDARATLGCGSNWRRSRPASATATRCQRSAGSRSGASAAARTCTAPAAAAAAGGGRAAPRRRGSSRLRAAPPRLGRWGAAAARRQPRMIELGAHPAQGGLPSGRAIAMRRIDLVHANAVAMRLIAALCLDGGAPPRPSPLDLAVARAVAAGQHRCAAIAYGLRTATLRSAMPAPCSPRATVRTWRSLWSPPRTQPLRVSCVRQRRLRRGGPRAAGADRPLDRWRALGSRRFRRDRDPLPRRARRGRLRRRGRPEPGRLARWQRLEGSIDHGVEPVELPAVAAGRGVWQRALRRPRRSRPDHRPAGQGPDLRPMPCTGPSIGRRRRPRASGVAVRCSSAAWLSAKAISSPPATVIGRGFTFRSTDGVHWEWSPGAGVPRPPPQHNEEPGSYDAGERPLRRPRQPERSVAQPRPGGRRSSISADGTAWDGPAGDDLVGPADPADQLRPDDRLFGFHLRKARSTVRTDAAERDATTGGRAGGWQMIGLASNGARRVLAAGNGPARPPPVAVAGEGRRLGPALPPAA